MKRFCLLLLLASLTFSSQAWADPTGSASNPTYPRLSSRFKNAKLPVEERVTDLLKQLTLEEKIQMLSGGGVMKTAGIQRLGIPEFLMSDGPMGTRNYGPSTAYPNGVALAASWNLDLAFKAGESIGRDARSRGVNILLAPGMNLYRSPLCGRNFEYLGEDPLVAGEIASAYIRGVQSKQVAATAKHFAGNEQEFDRNNLTSNIDERTLHELYLKPFSKAVKSGAWCVMNSYNPLNGVHATQNDRLNNGLLKGELGFRGLLMSDWNSSYDALGMANGGLDLEMPRGKFFNKEALLPLVKSGQVKKSVIDDKIARLLRMAFTLGWFDRPQADPSIPKDDPKSIQAALDGAREGMVLLKNEGNLLPLDPAKVKKLVILGPNSYPLVAGGAGSSLILPFHSVSVLEGLIKVGRTVAVTYIPWEIGQSALPPDCAEEVKAAGAVVVCAGFNGLSVPKPVAKRTEADEIIAEGEGEDRTYQLPPGQPEMIQAVAALNPRVVVVLNAGGSVETAGWLDKTPVLLHAFYPGQEGGTAIAELLFGKITPSGKLPFTWEKKWEDSAAFGNYPTKSDPKSNTYKEGVLLGYRWFDTKNIEPLFPFGFGLSYTSFELGGAEIKSAGEDTLAATVTVKNTGAVAGAEVVQVYVEAPKIELVRPVRELKGFSKVLLQPGESKSVTIHIPKSELAYWDPESKGWKVSPGDYTACIGDSSRNLPLKAGFKL